MGEHISRTHSVARTITFNAIVVPPIGRVVALTVLRSNDYEHRVSRSFLVSVTSTTPGVAATRYAARGQNEQHGNLLRVQEGRIGIRQLTTCLEKTNQYTGPDYVSTEDESAIRQLATSRRRRTGTPTLSVAYYESNTTNKQIIKRSEAFTKSACGARGNTFTKTSVSLHHNFLFTLPVLILHTHVDWQPTHQQIAKHITFLTRGTIT